MSEKLDFMVWVVEAACLCLNKREEKARNRNGSQCFLLKSALALAAWLKLLYSTHSSADSTWNRLQHR